MKNKIVLLLISYILFISFLNRDGIYGSSNKDIQCSSFSLPTIELLAKSLVTELTSPHVQSTWEFRGERVWVARLTVCYNYFKKKILNY